MYDWENRVGGRMVAGRRRDTHDKCSMAFRGGGLGQPAVWEENYRQEPCLRKGRAKRTMEGINHDKTC